MGKLRWQPAQHKHARSQIAMLDAALPDFSTASDIRKTQIVFCGLIAFVIARTFPAQCRYYQWFRSSNLEIAKHSGFGQSACKAWGIIPSPPALPYWGFVACGLLLIASLVTACTDVAPRLCIATSLVLYWVFYAQLY